MLKKFNADPALLFLLLGNLYVIWYYQSNPGSFNTIIWIYWCQSMIIGLFNFVYLLSGSKSTKNLTAPEGAKTLSSGCGAVFFLIHYGIFHLVYFFFILVKFSLLDVNRIVVFIALGIFIIESILQFVRQKSYAKSNDVNESFVFFIPYLRIIPMHLIILIPAFLNVHPSIMFLLLKTVTDLLSYKILKSMYTDKRIFQ